MNHLWSANVDFDGAVLIGAHTSVKNPTRSYSLIEEGEWMRDLTLPILETTLSEHRWRVWNISGFAVFDSAEATDTEISVLQRGHQKSSKRTPVALAMVQYARVDHRSRGIANLNAEPLSIVFEDVDTLNHFQVFDFEVTQHGNLSVVLTRLSLNIHCYAGG